jgi:hypothetical protein
MDWQALILAFFVSWQVRTLLGLIVLDVLMGVASAIKRGVFSWKVLANFYATNIVPYLLGYLAAYLSINLIMPRDNGLLTDGLVTLAWGALTGTLLNSIYSNLAELYPALKGLTDAAFKVIPHA